MAEESQATISNFAEFEAAGGKLNAAAEPAEKAAEPVEAAAEATEAPAETEEKPAAAPEQKPAKRKLSLSDEHARLLKEVTELRRERRELQQPPQPSPPIPAAAPDDKPPVRPKLSTFQGSLEEYEKEIDAYDEKMRQYQAQQYEKREVANRAKAEQERITQAYGAQLADHLKAHPDYDAEIAQTPMSPLMVDIVLHEGPQLGQALIDNKEEAQRISNLPRDYQIFEMGRLSARANGHAAAVEAEAEAEAEERRPVKVPAKLNATGGSMKAAPKNFAQWEIQQQQEEMARRQRFRR
jgi:hypothetical protein